MDIDIDFPTSFNPKQFFNWTKASIIKNDELSPHPCGYYPQNIPIDKLSGLASIPYNEAESLGYYKIDMLHLNLYEHFESNKEIEELLKIEPDWGLLTLPDVQPKLFQLANHGDVLNVIKPKSVEELADVLALIRPGKKPLVKLYRAQKESTKKILYAKDDSGYSFKKAHAIAYAMVIVLQLHLIDAKIL